VRDADRGSREGDDHNFTFARIAGRVPIREGVVDQPDEILTS
jgi:hypothetical protein